MDEGPQAGWYPDPVAPSAALRYWDGSWTELTRPTSVDDGSAPRSPRSPAGGRSMPITFAGTALVIGGIAVGVADWLSPTALALVTASAVLTALYYACLSAAYFLFAHAGFPYRSRGSAVVTYGLAAVYLVLLVLFVMVGLTSEAVWSFVLALTGLIGSVLTITFTVLAARNLMLPRGFRILVVVQLLSTMAANGLAYWGVPGATGLATVVVGAAYIVLAGSTRGELEAAASGTQDDRDRLRAARRQQRAPRGNRRQQTATDAAPRPSLGE